MKKIAIPGKKPGGLNSVPDSIFGRSELINIIEIDEKGDPFKVEIIPNTSKSEDGGVGVNIAQRLKKFGVTGVVLENIGPNGFFSLKKEGIEVFSFIPSENQKISDILALFNSNQIEKLDLPNRNPFFGSER